jgi:mono/diheme cytochrome c family protein
MMKKLLLLATTAVSMVACVDRDPQDPGVEYAPQMYASIPYDPYSQIDPNAYNEDGRNMRLPVPGTVARQQNGETLPIELALNYPYSKDSLEYAGRVLKNPLSSSDTSVMSQGKDLYTKYCQHCHGEAGDGQGPVAKKYGGVANLKSVADKPEGHIYHVITMGKGRMWAHGSQILPKDRWKIVTYVNTLRGYTPPASN